MDTEPDLRRAFEQLVEEYRASCLWFWREDYVPQTPEEQWTALDAIQRYGDASAYRRAGQLKPWLLRLSSNASAGS